MISPFPLLNLIRILIPIQAWSPFFTKASFVLLLISTHFICFSSSSSFTEKSVLVNSNSEGNHKIIESKLPRAMKIHPLPKKRNITIQYDMNPSTTRAEAQSLLTGGSHKKLRRLPHIFSRVLELPFRSDADVAVEESADCFKFVAETDGIGDVRAHTVEIHPGVTKIVIRPNNHVDLTSLNDLELDMWRFRLPESTRPELASAVYEDGELIVTVPKGGEVENFEDGGGGREGNGGFRGGMGNDNNNNWLVLVQ